MTLTHPVCVRDCLIDTHSLTSQPQEGVEGTLEHQQEKRQRISDPGSSFTVGEVEAYEQRG